MSKRAQSQTRQALKNGDRPEAAEAAEDEIGPFEDDYEDEYEDEVFEAEEEEDVEMQVDSETFIPGRNRLSEGEILEPDESTYELLHRLEPVWPCLSFDILKDHLGDGRARKKYPATVYSVAGTQAASGHDNENEVLVMKMSKLSRTEDSDDDEEETDPILETRRIKVNSCTNRIRADQKEGTLAAATTESGNVFIYDITPHLKSFDEPGTTITAAQNQPLHTVKNKAEGYAIDWSHRRLLIGDTQGRIHLTLHGDASWSTDSRFTGHTQSVEEVQWSPSEHNVFASGGADGTIRVWDIRSKSHKPAITVAASVNASDINVLSWSKLTTHLLASGAEDGSWAVWDLRQWKPSAAAAAGQGSGRGEQTHSPIAQFGFHKEQITSIEWHPTDDSVVCVCAGDDTATLWDLAVELDDEESQDTAGVRDIPPQLLFVHYMEQVKEAHWHPQIPGLIMSTGGSGFNVFKTISV